MKSALTLGKSGLTLALGLMLSPISPWFRFRTETRTASL